MSHALLYDSTKCVECEVCLLACKMKWGLPEGGEDVLSDRTLTVLENHDGHPVRRMCMHCIEPACASVCPVGALEKTADGPVTYDASKCIGCRYCMVACPFNVPRYEWESPTPRVRKCVMCNDRVDAGKAPACTLPCRIGAMKFGDRDELLGEAWARIRANPDRYHPHVYGEKEVGGTSVLIIAAVPPEKLGLPVNVPMDSLPKRTWQVLSRLPAVISVGATFCLVMWWLIHRRDRIAAEEIGKVRTRTFSGAESGALEGEKLEEEVRA